MTAARRIGAQPSDARALGRPANPIGRPWLLEELPTPPYADPRGDAGTPTDAHPAEVLEALRASMLDDRARAVTEAYDRGRAEGMMAGEAAALDRVRAALDLAGGAAQAVTEQERRFVGALEENLVALATAIARQVLDEELVSRPEVVQGLVRRALAQFPVDQPVRVRVHPDDLAMLTQALQGGSHELSWLADPLIVRGGFLVEGRERLVDGRVDTALERIYRHLLRID